MNREEEKLQAECFQWHWNHPQLRDERRMLHMNNNNAANAIAGNKNKAMGVVRGVADLEYTATGGRTIFIELKVGNNKQSDEQIDFMNKVVARGHQYLIIKTLEQFKELVCAITGKLLK